MLPVATIGTGLHRQPTPIFFTATTTATTTTTPSATTTTAARTPSGESSGSRVLPPVNVSESMSRDQLRQRTERVYWPAVHKGAMPPHIEGVAAAGTTGHKDATRTFPEAVSEGVTAAVGDNETGCDDTAENKVSQVSANVGTDSGIITD